MNAASRRELLRPRILPADRLILHSLMAVLDPMQEGIMLLDAKTVIDVLNA